MNYIGSKHKLSSFLVKTIQQVVGKLEHKVFVDLFAGTGRVGRVLKPQVKQVIANDLEYYSYVLNRHYIGNTQRVDGEAYLEELNGLADKEGFIYQNYCAGSGSGRMYFSDENGKKLDAMRQEIAHWRQSKKLDDATYFYLLTCLLEAADKVANTASVYGAFLKQLKATAQQTLKVVPMATEEVPHQYNEVYQQDANTLIEQIEGDILYLDPPYNARQYGANYHLLNTIALYDHFLPSGKTGLRPNYQKSQYCKKREVKATFEHLIAQAQFPYIFLSYNNEGLMTLKEIQAILQKYGKYTRVEKTYQRFKADIDENRTFSSTDTLEYLHILEKR